MTMQQVDSVEIPAGGLVAFKPGGFHIMLMELAKPLVKGETFDLTLHFEKAGDKTVTVTVKDA
jgi:copper(I)-binding protein